jgi:hypothetical protein
MTGKMRKRERKRNRKRGRMIERNCDLKRNREIVCVI